VTTLTVPPATEPGPYRVVAVADALNQQVEIEEGNNMLASTGTVTISLYRPDFALTAVSAPATGAAGRSLTITTTVRNVGPTPAGGFVVPFYRSAAALLATGDVLLGARAIGGLVAGASRTDMTTVTVPAGSVVPASYRILGVVDALGQQTELEENNNLTASGPLTASTTSSTAGAR